MGKYKIVAKTDGYTANRKAIFNGTTEVVIESNLHLKDAQNVLLKLYNQKYDSERPYAPNWGMAVIQSKPHAFGALPTFQDGTRSFDCDSIGYSIEADIEAEDE